MNDNEKYELLLPIEDNSFFYLNQEKDEDRINGLINKYIIFEFMNDNGVLSIPGKLLKYDNGFLLIRQYDDGTKKTQKLWTNYDGTDLFKDFEENISIDRIRGIEEYKKCNRNLEFKKEYKNCICEITNKDNKTIFGIIRGFDGYELEFDFKHQNDGDAFITTGCYPLYLIKKIKIINDSTSIFKDDIESIVKVIQSSPLLYNSLNSELKRNSIIIGNAYMGIEKYGMAGIDFYSVIEGSKNKVKIFREVFGNLPFSENILKILIVDEICAEKTTELLDEYKEHVMSDDKLLNDILCICGFVGFLKGLNDDYNFLLRMVKINGDCLLLASDRLKKDRYLIFEAVKSKPMVAFELGLSEDDPIIKTAIEIIRNNAHTFIELPCLDIN